MSHKFQSKIFLAFSFDYFKIQKTQHPVLLSPLIHLSIPNINFLLLTFRSSFNLPTLNTKPKNYPWMHKSQFNMFVPITFCRPLDCKHYLHISLLPHHKLTRISPHWPWLVTKNKKNWKMNEKWSNSCRKTYFFLCQELEWCMSVIRCSMTDKHCHKQEEN